MEIPVISGISGFEAGISHLQQNPSLVYSVFHLFGIEEIPRVHSFWTWGALILAVFATFSSVIHTTKFLILRLSERGSGASESLLRPLVDDDEDDTCSSSSSDDEDEATSMFEKQAPVDEDFRVAGSSHLKLQRRRSFKDLFSWSDFTSGRSVVKLWDGLGLELGFESSMGSLISIWDLNKNSKTTSFVAGRCEIPVVSMASPAVLLSAGLKNSGNAALRLWDTRIGRQIPPVYAEWQPRRKNIVGLDSGGVQKVYVRDDAGSLEVRDMRNLNLPLDVMTDSDGTTWWDADAVIVTDGDREDASCVDESPAEAIGSVVSRCRNAVKSYLF